MHPPAPGGGGHYRYIQLCLQARQQALPSCQRSCWLQGFVLTRTDGHCAAQPAPLYRPSTIHVRHTHTRCLGVAYREGCPPTRDTTRSIAAQQLHQALATSLVSPHSTSVLTLHTLSVPSLPAHSLCTGAGSARRTRRTRCVAPDCDPESEAVSDRRQIETECLAWGLSALAGRSRRRRQLRWDLVGS